jgi:hypothetical protein
LDDESDVEDSDEELKDMKIELEKLKNEKKKRKLAEKKKKSKSIVLKSLYSDTNILSKYIPSVQKKL